MQTPPPSVPHHEQVFRLYKANAPFAGQQCFADYLNQCLRDGDPLAEPWLSARSSLDAMIAHSSLSQSTTLYRATIDAFVYPYRVGNEIMYPAYMSTTTDEGSLQRHFACGFRDVPAALLKIECPPGLPALDMESDRAFGGHEQEVLLPRGSRFEVLDISEETDRQVMAEIISPVYVGAYTLLKTYTLRYARFDA